MPKKLTPVNVSAIVKEEVDNVKQLIKDLLAKKLAFFEEQGAAQKKTPLTRGFDFGKFYNTLIASCSDLALEVSGNPSNETIRHLRGILSDVTKALPDMDSGNARATLDKLYDLTKFPYIAVRKPDALARKKGDVFSELHFDDTADNRSAKAGTVRRAFVDVILKFLRENSMPYLGQDNIYPYSYDDFRNDGLVDRVNKEIKSTGDYLRVAGKKKTSQ